MAPGGGAEAPGSTREHVPARRLPLAYYALAHACLALAGLTIALDPRGVAGFHYHPRMLAVVHLVTLGWITASILGSLHLVAPLAFRAPVPPRPFDAFGFVAFAAAVTLMTAGFWKGAWLVMAVGAGVAVVAVALAVARPLQALRRAPVPPEVKAHLLCALFNLGLAAVAGVLLGVNKARPFLPGYVLSNVAAHAHLAGVGFATLTVMGAGYRMLPMILPAAMPGGPLVWASVALVEAGVLGLAAALTFRHRAAVAFALLILAGIAAFFSRVGWMLRHRRPAPSALPRPDLGAGQALLSLAWLAVACAFGVYLAATDDATAGRDRIIYYYAAAGLVGFLAQVVVGVASRLLPLAAWLWAFTSGGYRTLPRSPHESGDRRIQAAGIAAWTGAVVLLALGLPGERVALAAAGGWCLLAAAVASAANVGLVLHRLRTPPAAAAAME